MDNEPALLGEIEARFARYSRPVDFINRAHCDECEEHYRELLDIPVETISHADVENAGWDPTCFLSPEGFRYYFPGLARIADEHPDTFLEALVMRLNGHFDSLFTEEERGLVHRLLERWWLREDVSDWDRAAVEQALQRYSALADR